METHEIGKGPAPVFSPRKVPQSSFQQVKGAAEAKQPATAPLPGTGRLPLGVGELIPSDSLTEEEKQELAAIGWEDGKAVPGDMAERIAAAKQAAMAEATNPDLMPPPTAPDHPPLQMPAELDIDDLPEDKKRELQEALSSVGDMADVIKSRKQRPIFAAGAPDSVRAAAEGRTSRNDIPLADDRETREEPANEPEADSDEEPATAGSRKTCPNCNWDLAQSDPVKVTDDDKRMFQLSVLAGKQWQKIYELFGGALQVTVRQLRPFEVDECYRQAYFDRDQDELLPPDAWFEQLMRYRTCLQLLDVRSETSIHKFPDSLDGWERSIPEGHPTKLPAIEQEVYAKVIPTDSMARVMAWVVGQFERLVARLESEITDSDFWNATQSPT